MNNPAKILGRLLKRATSTLSKSAIRNKEIRQRVEYVCRQISNRACTRLLMACIMKPTNYCGIGAALRKGFR